MKKLKRTAAGLLLAGVMCVQALPMTAWAVDMASSDAIAVTDTAPTIVEATTNAVTEIRCDIDQTDYFTFEEKDSGVYEVTGVTEAFRQLENVSVTLAKKVQYVGEAAFHDCTDLKSVDFEYEEMTLDKDAFHGCTGLKKVAFEKIIAMGDYAFQGCEKLTVINLTNTKLRRIGDNAFASCFAVEDVVIGINDTLCDMPNGNLGRSILHGDDGLNYGTPYSLTFQLNLKKEDTFTMCDYTFNDGRVKEVHFEGDGDVVVGGNTFRKNAQLLSFDFSKVVAVGSNAFAECENLKEIHLLNKKIRRIGSCAFQGCDNANDIQVMLTDRLTIEGDAFDRHNSVGNTKPYSMTLYANNTSQFYLPDNFANADKLLNTFEVVGNGELYYCDRNFSFCENLTKVNVGNATGFGEDAFKDCYKLKSLDLTSAHRFGEDAFKNCSELESLKLGVYDNSQWGEGAFDNIMSANTDEDGNKISATLELYMNNTKTFPLGSSHNDGSGIPVFAENVFKNMYNLTSVKTYGDGELELYDEQFSNCQQLESFDFSNVTFIGKSAFVNTGLREAKITRTDIMIENRAFGSCDNLTLYGYTGSTVEAYATANSIPFVALDDGTTTTSTTGQGSSTTTTTVTTQGSSGTILLGDVTLDGRVDISDAVLLNKSIAGSVVLNEQAKDNAECYADGNLDGNDATTLLRFLVHTITSLPVTE